MVWYSMCVYSVCVYRAENTIVLSCQCINHRRHFILFLFIVVVAHIARWLAGLAWPGLAIFNKTQTVCFAVLVELNIFLSCSHSPPVFDPFAVHTINTCAMRTNTKYKSAKRSLLVKIDTVVSFHFRCECDTMWFDTSTNRPTDHLTLLSIWCPMGEFACTILSYSLYIYNIWIYRYMYTSCM